MLLFLRKSESPEIGTKSETNIPSSLEFCLEDIVYEAIKTISLQGGNFELKNYLEDENVEYLCYHPDFLSKCITLQPVLVNHVKTEIGKFLFPYVESCFNSVEKSLGKKEYEMNFDLESVDVNLTFKEIIIGINSEVVLTKGGETSIEGDYKLAFPSKFYDLLITVQDLVYGESQFCDFDSDFYNMLYSQFEINQTLIGYSKLYSVKDMRSNEEFKFAVRGC